MKTVVTLTWYRHFERNGGLNQILKRQTSRFHYSSKIPAVTITVFITILKLFCIFEKKVGVTKAVRDRPFNLQGRGVMFFFVSFRIFFSDNTRVRIFFLQNLTLGYMTKTLNQIIFFSSIKIRIFFSATLGIRIFF